MPRVSARTAQCTRELTPTKEFASRAIVMKPSTMTRRASALSAQAAPDQLVQELSASRINAIPERFSSVTEDVRDAKHTPSPLERQAAAKECAQTPLAEQMKSCSRMEHASHAWNGPNQWTTRESAAQMYVDKEKSSSDQVTARNAQTGPEEMANNRSNSTLNAFQISAQETNTSLRKEIAATVDHMRRLMTPRRSATSQHAVIEPESFSKMLLSRNAQHTLELLLIAEHALLTHAH